MASKTSLTISLRVDGIADTLRAFQRMPKDANAKLRDAAQAISRDVATSAAQAGRRDETPQSALVAKTVKAVRDRTPAVTVGGTRKLGRHRVPAYALVFASEFGMNKRSGWYARPRYRGATGRQYQPHSGREGHWFFPTIEGQQSAIARRWHAAADAIIDEVGEA